MKESVPPAEINGQGKVQVKVPENGHVLLWIPEAGMPPKNSCFPTALPACGRYPALPI
jgi:hypothetical protein